MPLPVPAPATGLPFRPGSGALLKDWSRSERAGLISTAPSNTSLTTQVLADSGLHATDVNTWVNKAMALRSGWGHAGRKPLALASLFWVLRDLSSTYPTLTMTAGMGWALATAHERGLALVAAADWSGRHGLDGLNLGWLCESAGTTMAELRNHVHDPDVSDTLALMASLRGYHLPAHWSSNLIQDGHRR